ncbi:MAG: hypothetical protein L6367_09070 [Cellulomonas sp.]|nr:hypothetical protein [Cellulomonas sp.]
MTTVYGPDHEPAAWLRALETARLEAMRAEGVPLDGSADVVTTLRDPSLATSWGRWCSRCQVQVPANESLSGLVTTPLPGVVLAGALCPACAVAETADASASAATGTA